MRIKPQDVPQYSKKDLAYQQMDERLKDLISYEPSIDAFANAIQERKKKPVDRKLLISQIHGIYEKRSLTPSQLSNLSALNEEDTFTLVTAHQPSLLTGPLYYIYKICSVIKSCHLLSDAYPDQHFVPIFISGSEDHDFEEINHCNIFNKRIEWNENAGGAVGRMPIEKLDDVVNQFSEILGSSEHASQIRNILYEALNGSTIYKHFNFNIVNELFANFGLLVVDMDRKEFKAAFSDHIIEEIIKRPSENLVLKTQQILEERGISNQAHPRDINFFYLKDNFRTRITYENGRYQLVDTEISFSEAEIKEEIHNHPERFSPNVIMRPIYQESILPNLAYIGGGGEIAYWLERKSQFEHFNVPFPILMRRNSALLVDKSSQKLLRKLDMDIPSFFPHVDDIINHYIKRESEINIDLGRHKGELSQLFTGISKEAEVIDPTISKWIQAERVKQLKVIDQIESRLKRTIKQQEEVTINQIRKLKDKLFPGNGLQERQDNFFQYAVNQGSYNLIQDLIEEFRPFTPEFLVMYL
ncbi:MAG: bacillithiol biosynthesis cysteine-adding enzyme BshC [Saprospiraceae bacterium]|nr:bacillithiol biosynthesis cysteine-adding enzyme BshC [Saprospiraceae bacterium]